MGSAKKRALVLSMSLAFVIGATGCVSEQERIEAVLPTAQDAATVASDLGAGSGQDQEVTELSEGLLVSYDDEDLDDAWDTSRASFITLADGSVRFDGTGAVAQGTRIAITSAGTYVVSGIVTEGQIVIDLEDSGTVKLVLSGAHITSTTGAPIYVKSADKAVITLAEGTQNSVTRGAPDALDDSDSDEADAAIFSKDDLTINGAGTLTVTAEQGNGIASRDQLKIITGRIAIDAANDALKGKDCVGFRDAAVTIMAGADGVESSNDTDAGKGFISIEGGTLDITAGLDGIQAQTTLLIMAGDISITTGGGSVNGRDHVEGLGAPGGDWTQGRQGAATTTTTAMSDGTTTVSTSAKGLKGTVGVFVQDGSIAIDSSDDSVHSNNTVVIEGGNLTLASGDDGIHADATLEINGGDIDVTDSYEGIESAVITINDGIIHIDSSDDGINVAGGNDESSANGPRGQDAFTVNENNQLYINGGYIAVDATGDGVDCNGRIFMSAGTLILNGPTVDMNGAIDYLGEFTVTGGYVVAVGSSGMAEAPSQSSSQYSVMVNFAQAMAAGTLIHVEDEEGVDILTFAPTKQFQSVVLCSPDIRDGATYTVFVGGGSTGVATDSLYSGGNYTPGTEYVTLTISDIVTMSGAFGGMRPVDGQGQARPDGSAAPGGGG